jgi:hypothetical protein
VKEPFGHEEKQKKKGNEHGVNDGFFLGKCSQPGNQKQKG